MVHPPGVEGATVRAIVVDALRVPDVAVIVTVDAPAVAVALAVNITKLVPAAGFVLKVTVTPVGSPVAARVALPANGLISVTVIVSVALPP